MIQFLSLFLVFPLLIESQVDTIEFFVTIRSFIAAPCRIGSTVNYTVYCPDDPELVQQMLEGKISGHPDFERRVEGLYNSKPGSTIPYNGSFAKFGKQFPITFTSTNPKIRPYVNDVLTTESTGISKMVYCTDQETCEEGKNVRTLNSSESFSSWYSDSRMYNRRFGYKQPLFRINSVQFGYDSGDFNQNPLESGLYDPISSNNLLQKAWPLSPIEKLGWYTGNGLPEICPDISLESCVRGKFWFTTELHTSFQYQGGEEFTFTGDDDVHVFINNRLAINLGGEHAQNVRGTIRLDQYTQELNITLGGIYSFDLFHVERQTPGSNYKIETTIAAVCNTITLGLRSSDDVSKGIDWTETGSTKTSDWLIIAGPGYGFELSEKVVRLMQANVPNVVSYMFHRNQQNVGSGFALKFKFRMSGTGNGFALVFQNRDMGLSNFNGGIGPNLGIKNLQNSFAVVFNTCPNFPACGDNTHISLHYPKNRTLFMNSNSLSTRSVYDDNVVQNWTDSQFHSVNILFYAYPPWLEVYVDDSLRLVKKDLDISSILNGRNSFVGFTSASGTTDSSKMNVDISSVVMTSVKVSTKSTILLTPIDNLPLPFVADGRTPVSFVLKTRDACSKSIEFGGFSSYVKGILILNEPSQQPQRLLRNVQTVPTVINATVVDKANGEYSVDFTSAVAGIYDVYLTFGEGCDWNGVTFVSPIGDCWSLNITNASYAIPYVTFAPTDFPAPDSLPYDWRLLVGVGVGLAGLICCMCCIVLGLLGKRNKWRKDKKYVKTGQLAILDKEVDLGGNPLGDKLAELTSKLQETTQEVLKLRAYAPKEDKTEEVEEIKAQTKALKEQVFGLKRKKQEEELASTGSSFDEVRDRRRSERIEFRPQPVGNFGNVKDDVTDLLVSVPPPPATITTAVFVPKKDPHASFLVSISKRDVDAIIEQANLDASVYSGGDIFGQFYENGDCLVMHSIGPGTNAIMTKDNFVQDEEFVRESMDYLAKHSAFKMGIWLSRSMHQRSVKELISSGLEQCKVMGSPKWFLLLVVELCGIKNETMQVTIMPYRFENGTTPHQVGELYVFEDDKNDEANKRHKALEVLRSRPSGTTRDDQRTKLKRKVSNSLAPPPALPKSRAPPPLTAPPPGSGVITVSVTTPRRMSIGGEDSEGFLGHDDSELSFKKSFFRQDSKKE